MSDAPLEVDVAVLGSGPGGYSAAFRAADLGKRVALVERHATLGGVCLNVGCIPSKALLDSSERFAETRDHGAEHGIVTGSLELDLGAMMARKDKVVAGLVKGVGGLLKKAGAEAIHGTARIEAPGRVAVALADGGERSLACERILIATGSESTPLPGVPIDEERIVSSTGALALKRVPDHLVVIGAGVIGLELGSVWSRLGAKVTVVEWLDRILPGMDAEIAKHTQRILTRQGLAFSLGRKALGAESNGAGVVLRVEPSAGGEAEDLRADVVLVCIGRRPYTEGLGLDAIGIETDARGFIPVDGRFQTSVPGVFAIGDCAPGPMLAHKAEEEGIVCVEGMAGQSVHIDHALIPGVVYTWPEVASVGRSEESLVEEGIPFVKGSVPFQANCRARTTGDTQGLAKVLAHAETDALLGVHIVGPAAGELIQEAVTAMSFGGASEDLARISHAHPGFSEAVKEAALATLGRAIHA